MPQINTSTTTTIEIPMDELKQAIKDYLVKQRIIANDMNVADMKVSEKQEVINTYTLNNFETENVMGFTGVIVMIKS